MCLWNLRSRAYSVGSNQVRGFGIFGEFGCWVLSLVLVDEPGFGRVRTSVCPDLGMRVWPISGQTCSKFGIFGGVRSSVLVDEPGSVQFGF